MKSLIIFLAILAFVCCSCPAGLDIVRDGECRGLASTIAFDKFEGTGKRAAEECAKLKAQPVIIHNDEHEVYWATLAPNRANNAFLFLGLVCNETSRNREYMWADGSKLDYKPVMPDFNGWSPALDKPCVSDLNWYIQPNGAWNIYFEQEGGTGLFYCTKQLEHEENAEDACTDDECYEVGTTAQSWQDAQATCQMFGADLATIHNQKENDYVRRVAVAKGAVYGVFVGASAKKDGTYGWIDGSAMDYQNFYPGFPRKNYGDCIAMDTSTATGQWMNNNCQSKLPVVCMKKRATTGAPVCTGEDYAEGTIITSPGFPYIASIPCDYFLTVAPGKKVQLEIILLEANSCCDTLILYDGYIGGSVLAKVSGNVLNTNFTTVTSNIMRVSWQPNGGVNVRGLTMSYRAV